MIIHNCEQRSPEWHALRLGMPTASDFSKVITSKGEKSESAKTYALTLAAELYAKRPVDDWGGNAWTERGRAMEQQAIAYYSFMRDADVMPVGFVTDGAGEIGCSPDGLIGSDGLIEVKCLKAENHIKAILYHQEHGRCQADYIAQSQGQMWICDRKWCDLVFFHPDLPLLIVRQAPIPAVVQGLATALAEVIVHRDRALAALHRQGAPTQKAAA